MQIPFNNATRSFFQGTGTYRQAGLAGLGDVGVDANGNVITENADGTFTTSDINGNVVSVTTSSPDNSGTSIFSQLVGAIPQVLSAEAAQNVISQQNNAANALLAVNTARANQGLAPLSSLSPITGAVGTISTSMLLIIGAVILFAAMRK